MRGPRGVNRTGHEFLPGAAFSNNQNGIAMRVGALDRSIDALHRNRDAHEATHGDPETSMAWETHSRVGSGPPGVPLSAGGAYHLPLYTINSIRSRGLFQIGNRQSDQS